MRLSWLAIISILGLISPVAVAGRISSYAFLNDDASLRIEHYTVGPPIWNLRSAYGSDLQNLCAAGGVRVTRGLGPRLQNRGKCRGLRDHRGLSGRQCQRHLPCPR